MNFTDTHSHINAAEFEQELDLIVARSGENGVKRIIIPAVSSLDYKAMERIEQKYSGIYLAYGLHPTEIDNECNLSNEIEILKSKISEKRMVAIGESGLDKYWSKEFIDKQIESLRAHIELSIENDLPIILHTRDAFPEMLSLLKEYKGKLRGVFHGYSGTIEQAKEILSLGDFYFGIGGVVTFKNSTLPSVVEDLPLSRIVLETDAPYLAPTPHRGKINEPSFIPIIAEKIAQIKNISIEEVAQASEQACNKLFRF